MPPQQAERPQQAKRPVTGLIDLNTTPTAAHEVRQLFSQKPLTKIIHVSSRSTNADRRPCGVTTQDLQFGNRVDPTATGRLCVQAHPQHLSMDYNPNDTIRQGYPRPTLREAPRLSIDSFIGRRPANSELVGQAKLRNITRRLRMRQMFPALQPREGLVPGQVTDPTIGIGIASRRWM